LAPENNIEAAQKAGESQGKSGSFFFFSTDKKFIIKTMTNNDLSTFKKLFKDYTNHVSINKDSLLARVYGIFTIKKEDMVPVHLILMGNTMQTKALKHVFDLKGSMVNRKTKGTKFKPTTTLKDINLL
jgi:1-phosphatidylinositol-4-phosphate 5-kinase